MPPKVKLLNDIPPDRYRMISKYCNPPKKGDIVLLDQGFTSEDGKAMVIAYLVGDDGSFLCEVEVFETELE